MTLPPSIRVNTKAAFPSIVQGSGPITIAKVNGVWTVGFNSGLLGTLNTAAPITGGPITNLGGTIGLAISGVSPGSYTNTNLTVDAFGRITSAANGGGGGGGAVVVATVAGLSAVSPSAGLALVSDARRGGPFYWNSADLHLNVAADAGQAIYSPPASDPSGASGCWVRLYSGPVQAPWFQFINDGVVTLGPASHSFFGDYRSSYTTTVVSGTDNSVAWNFFLPWARFESNNGRAVDINFPPGSYNYNLANMNTGSNFPGFYGIKTLRVIGYGAIFTNVYDESISGTSFLASPWLFATAPFVTGPLWAGDGVIPAGGAQPLAFLLNTTAVGDISVGLVTAARNTYFSVGEWVFVGSYDIQMSGYPPNMYYGDFNQIAAINAGTGVISLETPLQYAHRSDFNDYTATGSTTYPCGAARIWKLDTTGYGYGIPVPWDIDHQYVGVQVNEPPNRRSPGFYTTLSGRRFRTNNWKGVGFSQTIMMESNHEGDHYWTQSEPDKNVKSISYKDCISDFNISFQSSSIDRVTFDNCTMGGLGVGAKTTHVRNSTIKTNIQSAVFNLSATQGLAGECIFDACALIGYTPNIVPGVLDGAAPLVVSSDGSTPITFANGSFILAKATGQSLLPSFIGVPGQYVGLRPASATPAFAGDLGVGIVIGMRSDTNNVYIDTTLQYATLPAWALTGVLAAVNVFGNGTVLFSKCNGSDQARMVSEACDAGDDYWNRKTYNINGFSIAGQLAGWLGSLICADINVKNPSAAGADVVTFSVPTYNSTTMAADAGGTVLTINCGVAGHRVITQAMWLNKLGTDGITVGGAAAPFLPGSRLLGDVAQFGKSSFGATLYLTPLIECTFLFSTGQTRKRLTRNTDRTTSVLMATNGLLV